MISWTNSWSVVCKGNPTARETETKWFAAGSSAQESSPLRRDSCVCLPNDVERSAAPVCSAASSQCTSSDHNCWTPEIGYKCIKKWKGF